VAILASDAGTFKAAKALYASNAGEWVEVPLGGGAPAWTRPADWLPMNVTAGEQKVQILIRVSADPTAENERVMTVAASGAYTVNWGDGSPAEDIADGLTAKHLYNPTALAGTTTSDGWLQALVTVTPQASGTLSTLSLASAYYATKTWVSPAVEIVVGPELTNFSGQPASALARVEFKTPVNIGFANSMFMNCRGLREIIGEIKVSGGGMANMFNGCSLLTKFPTITMTGPNPTDVSGVFTGCASMVDVPQFTTTAATLWVSTFQGCTSLREVPSWVNVSNGTNFGSMFLGCASLVKVPATFNTSKSTAFTSMFSGCTLLSTLPPLNLSLATGSASMFLNCTVLENVSLTTTSALISMASMFNGCSNLTKVTGLDMSGPTAASGFTSMFLNCPRLGRIGVLSGKGPRFTMTLAGTFLDTAALNDFYTQLPTVTGQTLTVTNVPGTLGDDPTIATAKGWTVTGS